MSLKDKLKSTGKWIGDKYKEHAEYIRERKEFLNDLTMSQLKIFSKEYDIKITWYFDEKPGIKDYIDSIARSSISTEKIQRYVYKIHRLEEKDLSEPKSDKHIHQHFHDKAEFKLDHSSLAGDVTNIDIVLNDFNSAIINSNLDSDLIIQSIKNIDELRKEFNKPVKDRYKVEKILEWFKNNKQELVKLALPFIQKILDNI